MVDYVEKFVVNRRTYGIEDQGEERNEYAPKQYRLWAGGCGIGSAESLPEARQLLHTYIVCQTSAERGSASDAYARADADLKRLGADPFNLGRFLCE